MNTIRKTCPCGTMTEQDCMSSISSELKPLRLHNNAGSPGQLNMLDKMTEIFSKSEPENFCIYFNANDTDPTNIVATELRETIAIRENVAQSSINFFSGGYSLLNMLMAGLQPKSSLTMKGDFIGYKKTAGPRTKVYEAEPSMTNLIGRAAIIQPEIILFTDGETNPSLVPVDSTTLTRELRRVSPDSLIVIDQAYGRHHGDSLSINKLALEDENTIFLRCASKDSTAVGLRFAWTISLPGGRADALICSLLAPYDVSMDTAKKAIELYAEPEILDAAIRIQASARILITQKLRELGVEVRTGASPWILFRPKMDAEQAVDLLKANDVHLQLQDPLHPTLNGMIRLSTTTCPEMQLFYAEAVRLNVI